MMSWRTTQLQQELCDQDRIILDLFTDMDVNYVGKDIEFKNLLNHNDSSTNLILIINHQIWCSEVVALCHEHLRHPIKTFYIGINRYCIKGNDTVGNFCQSENQSQDIIEMINNIVTRLGYTVAKSGHYNTDLGRYFNFVQPLTWVYGYEAFTSN